MKKLLLAMAALAFAGAPVQAQWVNQPITFSSTAQTVVQVSAVDGNTAWALSVNLLGADEDAARTTNGGATWTAGALNSISGLGTNEFMTYLYALDANTAWATTVYISGGGRVLKTTNGGATWTTQTTSSQFSSGDSYPNFVHFFNANEGVAVGDPDGATAGFEIYTTSNSGTTWTRVANVPAASSTELGALNFIGMSTQPAVFGNSLWFATDEGRVFYSANKGQTWSVSNTNLLDEIGGLSFTSATTGLALVPGAPHLLARTTDGGATWTSVTYSGPLHGVAIDNVPGKSVFVSVGADDSSGGDSGSSYSSNNGQTWTSLESTLNHTALDVFSPTVAWTGGVNLSTLSGQGVYKLNTTVLSSRRDAATQQALTVYPNPSADGNFTLNLAAGLPSATDVRVLDALGRAVYTRSLGATGTQPAKVQLDLSKQRAGLYTLELRTAEGVATQKLVIQ